MIKEQVCEIHKEEVKKHCDKCKVVLCYACEHLREHELKDLLSFKQYEVYVIKLSELITTIESKVKLLGCLLITFAKIKELIEVYDILKAKLESNRIAISSKLAKANVNTKFLNEGYEDLIAETDTIIAIQDKKVDVICLQGSLELGLDRGRIVLECGHRITIAQYCKQKYNNPLNQLKCRVCGGIERKISKH